jgi:hypothetical protein
MFVSFSLSLCIQTSSKNVHLDNLVFACLREDLDSAANKRKEDKIIITGITSKTPPPNDPE